MNTFKQIEKFYDKLQRNDSESMTGSMVLINNFVLN